MGATPQTVPYYRFPVLYIMQRYFIGIGGLFYLALAGTMFLLLSMPDTYPLLERPGTFQPIINLFQITGAAVACFAIMSVLPFVTDGSETQGMHTPFAHPGIHATLILAVVAIPLLVFSATQPEFVWQAGLIADGCRHVLQSAAAAAAVVFLAFYPIKWKLRLASKLRNERLKEHYKP